MRMFHDHIVSREDLTATIACVSVIAAWIVCGSHVFSWMVIVFFAMFVPACLVAGNAILHALAPGLPEQNDFPTRLLIGFFAVNTVLYFLASFLSFPLVIIATAVIFSILAIGVLGRLNRHEELKQRESRLAGLLCVVLALLGATVWSRDSLTCTVPDGDVTICKPWGDSFCHAYLLSLVSSPGVPRDNPRLAGKSLGPYHFASYTIPAVITKISSTSPYEAFNCLQVPLGLFLAGLAAFVLVKSWWGCWPGLAAAAFLFLPDGAWLGVHNYWLSFHWLAQISPGCSYGIALIVVCWILMFQACKTGRFLLLLASYAGLALCIQYKSHIFVANAFLLWVYPAFFMAGWSRKMRIGWMCFALISFGTAVSIANMYFSSYVPTIRIDGSALKSFMPSIVSSIEVDAVKTLFSRFTGASSLISDIAWGACLMWTCVFGVFGIAWIALSLLLSKRVALQPLLFPLLVVANYLVMTLGLPASRGSGEPDELLHRPFIWAYFVVVTWVGGAAYYYCFANAPPRRRGVQVALTCMFLAALAMPLFSNRVIHQGANLDWTAKYCRIPVPTKLIDCCRYIREHSRPIDVVQDSQFDPHLYVAGFTGLRSFAAGTEFGLSPSSLKDRVALLKDWQAMEKEDQIRDFASQNDIRWLIVHHGDMLKWPPALLSRPDFESGDYRVYRFNINTSNSTSSRGMISL
jgi:hypothetical protein